MSSMKFSVAHGKSLEIEIILPLRLFTLLFTFVIWKGGWGLTTPQNTTTEANQHQSHQR